MEQRYIGKRSVTERTRKGGRRRTIHVWQQALTLLTLFLSITALLPASSALAEELAESSTDDAGLAATDSKWKRLAGNNRYDTMSVIVSEGFTSSEWAVLATGENFADALVASSVAGALDAPIILTKTNKLSDQASNQLESLGVKYVYIMGGESAVSKNVENTLKAKGLTVGRIEGGSRQATSIAALTKVDELGKLTERTVIIATGKNFADALSIGPMSYRFAMPILLTKNDGTLTNDQIKACKRLGVNCALVLGGTNSVSDKVWDQLGLVEDRDGVRVAGNNRYETSAKIAQYESLLGFGVTHVGIATGENYPDALAGVPLCGKSKSQLLLVKNEKSVTLDRIKGSTSIETGYVLGGESAVSAELFNYLKSVTQ